MKIVLILFAIFLLVSPSLGQSEKCIFQQPNHVGICGGTSTICTLYLQFYREEKKLAQINAEQKENIEIDKNFTTEETNLRKIKINVTRQCYNAYGRI